MKYIYRSIFLLIVLSTTLLGSCKKQVRCGCDGDVINTFETVKVTIEYDEENGSAQFRNEMAPTAIYYFCNPTDMMPELIKFENGEKVLITCELLYECNYMMQASNSYYSYYQAYMAKVTKIESSLYGND